MLLEKCEARELLAGDIWSQRGGDSGHSSYVDTAVNPTSIAEAWFAELNYSQSGTGSWRERGVAIDESHVYRTALEGYAPSGTYHVIAYDLQTGEEVWHKTLTGGAFEGVSEPSLRDGVVYVNRAGHSGISGGTSSDLPRLYGFDSDTGNLVLQQTYAAQWGSGERPVIDDDQLFVEDGYYGGISAYQASTLSEQWFVGRSAAYSQPLSAVNDQFVFAFGTEVYNRYTGERLANMVHPVNSGTMTSPIVAESGDVLYTTAGVALFDGDTREHLWTASSSSGVNFKAIGGGRVAFTSGRELQILDQTDGSLLQSWQSPSNLGEVLLTDTHVLVISLNYSTATVHAIDIESGDEVWNYSQVSPGGSALLEMAFSQGRLVLSDRTGVRTFAVSDLDLPPIASDDEAITDEDQAVTINVLANDSDPEGGPLSIVTTSDPENGSVAINSADGTVTYTPLPNFWGSDAFTYTIEDAGGMQTIATVSLLIEEINDAPVAADAFFSLPENSSNGTTVGSIEASDIDGDALNFALQDSMQSAFKIDPESGEISVRDAALLDYETTPTFDLVVVISDGRGEEINAPVQVDLTNQLEVEIDILPGDPSNQVNLKRKKIEVAILANSDLDPLTMLDFGSLRLQSSESGSAARVPSHRKHGFKYETRDVNGDGKLDVVIQFQSSDTGLSSDDTSLLLSGSLLPEYGGESFSVEQDISVSQSRRKGKR
ncbi:Ig-like domain-containing protein [Novipirellula maiorica]|uniref:Ig-like domain-containing protein n=1 Tax=Novipirellula maiorica TaxID=1265734 RepID=UPI001F2A994D|nr:Ig-like domain-containing protein [Rhodopirellula maiorica]